MKGLLCSHIIAVPTISCWPMCRIRWQNPAQAVIAIKSAALNFFDLLMIQGQIPDQAAVSVLTGSGSRGRDRERRRPALAT